MFQATFAVSGIVAEAIDGWAGSTKRYLKEKAKAVMQKTSEVWGSGVALYHFCLCQTMLLNSRQLKYIYIILNNHPAQ